MCLYFQINTIRISYKVITIALSKNDNNNLESILANRASFSYDYHAADSQRIQFDYQFLLLMFHVLRFYSLNYLIISY